MNNLVAALLQAGVITQEKHDEIVAGEEKLTGVQVKQKQSQLTRKSHAPINIDQLDTATSVSNFRRAALNILLLDSSNGAIAQAIEKAQRFKEADGGKKLIWQMHQVKDGFKTVKSEEREQFLRRALRRAGGTFKEVEK